MKENDFKKAQPIVNKINVVRAEQRDVREKRDLCRGNTSEVANRKFQISVYDGVNIKSVYIHSRVAESALNEELKIIDAEEQMLLKELEKL